MLWCLSETTTTRDVDQNVGQDMPELKPVETGPLPVPPTGAASPVEEAGTIRHETGAGSPRPSVAGGRHAIAIGLTREASPPLILRGSTTTTEESRRSLESSSR